MSARRVPGLLSIFLLALVTGHATAEAALTAPFSLVATAVSSSQINLSWRDANPGSVSYSIERSLSATSGFTVVGAADRQSAYQDTGLASGTSYYYRVRALKPGGSASAYSNIAIAMTLGDRTAPSVPTGLTASPVGCGQINLAWNGATDTGGSGLLGYKLYRGGLFQKQVLAPATSTSDVGLTAATAYSYALAAIDKAGNESAKSIPVSATTGTCLATTTTSTTVTTSTTSTTTSTRPPTTTTSTTTSSTILTTTTIFTTTTSSTILTTTTSSSTSTTTASSSTTSTTAPPKPPIANAGPDQFTQTMAPVGFNGGGSFDLDGTLIAYAWSFGDGGSASGMVASHMYTTPGTYSVILTVTDNSGLRSSDAAVVSVANRPPVANAGPDQTASAGSAVTFNGSGSDPDGTVGSYGWDFGDGTSAAGATVSHGYAAPGSYTATLTVTDDRGARGTDSALVTVTGSAGSRWAHGFGGTASDVGYGVAVDASGNTVMTGRVESIVDVGGGVVCPPAAVFVSKTSQSGAAMWAKCLGGDLGGGTGRGVAIDGNGNVLVTGKFSGTVDFGTGPLSSAGAADIFLAKYSAAGDPIWSKAFGSGMNDIGNGVAVDSGGNVVLIGTAGGGADFGGGPIMANGYSVVVAKFSPTGAYLWSMGIGDSFSNSGNAVAVDPSGNIAVTGAFSGPADFGGGVLTSAGVDIFLAKLSPAGGHLWSRHFGSALAVHAGNGVACDGSGNVLVTGSFENSIDLGAGWATSFAHKDMFVAKYSPAGGYLWSRLAGGLFDDAGSGIAVDMSGKVVVTGTFQAAVNFGAGSLTSAGRTDIFVARYAADGTPLGAQRFGGADFDAGTAVAVDGGGRPVVTGAYRLGVDFGGTPLTAAGMDDIFLLASW